MNCKCTFAQSLVGDGCDECNPEKAKELKTMKLSELTQEQKRIAIAEACGWRLERTGDFDAFYSADGHYRGGATHNLTKAIENAGVPDYLNDLNAMHEAWKPLTNYQKSRMSYYMTWLIYDANHWFCENTSSQIRADAFLLATGRAEL
jgi:hypothetical protein